MSADTLRFAVFDLDGTLIDSVDAIVEGVRACWAACGFPEPDPAAVRRIIGLPWEESIRTLLPGAGEREFTSIRAYHDEVARGLRRRPDTREILFEGAETLLEALEADGFVLGIVTSRNTRRLHRILEEHGLTHRFVTVKTPDHGPGKPNPHLMFQAMDEVGAVAASTVMVGDTTFDMMMAKNASAHAIGVSWGVHDTKELIAAGAGRVVDAFPELRDAIGMVTGARSHPGLLEE